MGSLMNIFWSPTKVFSSLKEKPQWAMPFIIILIWIALTAASTVLITRGSPEALGQQEEMMRERGMSEEQIEQAMQIARGPIPVIAGGIAGAIVFAIRLVLFTLILNLFIPLFGGTSGYKVVLTVVSYSSLVTIPGSILRLILMAITKSPFVTTSLALLAQDLERTSFLYGFLSAFDFFILWEMALVALGISLVSNVKKQNAYILVLIIWFISIFIGIGLQSLGSGPR